MKKPYLIVPCLAVPVAAAPDPEPALDGDGAVAGAGPRDGVLEDLHGGRLPRHGLEVEGGEVVGALPLLLVGGDVVHDEGDPPAEDEHAAVDEGGRVEGARQRRGAVDDRLRPRHRVDVQDPQVAQPVNQKYSIGIMKRYSE